ncbi:hypothetical protein PMAC_003375 [Pneumocystis sp. 'macacae']|nr:hypothetical protein PMAC_003375 [Pneumocystis sp. 'macacae']
MFLYYSHREDNLVSLKKMQNTWFLRRFLRLDLNFYRYSKSSFLFFRVLDDRIHLLDEWNRYMMTHTKKEESKLIKQPRNSNIMFVVLLTVLGSQAIHVLSIKQEFNEFETQIDTKISLLRDIIDRIQRGEDVDVSKELGTGVKKQEKEWSDVMQQIIENEQ